MSQSQAAPRAGVPSFAGLRSLFAPGASRAEDDKPAEDDDEGRKARRAEEDARRAEEDDRRKEEDARRAEEDDDGKPEDGDKDKDGKKGKAGKKAANPEDDDESCEEEDDEDAAVAEAAAAGRRAERARWVNALNDPAVAPHAAAACVMLATTDMHSSAIVATVKAMPAPVATRPGLRNRMAETPIPNVGSGADAAKPSTAAAIVAAGRKARGEKD